MYQQVGYLFLLRLQKHSFPSRAQSLSLSWKMSLPLEAAAYSSCLQVHGDSHPSPRHTFSILYIYIYSFKASYIKYMEDNPIIFIFIPFFCWGSSSCMSKVFVGLKPQSSGCFATGGPNLTSEFHNRVRRSLKSRLSNKKATRAQFGMMPIGTPRVPYRTPGEGTWQWVDLWNALYRERVIFIGQHIDEEFSNQILATMLYLDSMDSSKKLYLYINGPGGDLTPSMAIYDTMQSLKSPVATQCVGYAYNLAGFLLAAGDKGSRVAMPLSRIALQSPAGAARGQADDVQNEANELLRIRNYLFKELAAKTGQSVDKIDKDLSRMKRFNAQEALEYGLIDRVLRPPRIKADAPRKENSGATGLG